MGPPRPAHHARKALRDDTTRACAASWCTTATERAARQGGIIRHLDGTTAYSPIWNWSSEQVWQHLAASEIPINPGLRQNCGASALSLMPCASRTSTRSRLEHGSATWHRAGWPELHDELVKRLPVLGDYA